MKNYTIDQLLGSKAIDNLALALLDMIEGEMPKYNPLKVAAFFAKPENKKLTAAHRRLVVDRAESYLAA